MVTGRRTALAVTLAVIMGMGSAAALADGISGNAVKIGVLTDMSGQFSHESGEGAVTAVRMAIDELIRFAIMSTFSTSNHLRAIPKAMSDLFW